MLEDKNENENENKTGADKENLQLAGAVVNKSKTSNATWQEKAATIFKKAKGGENRAAKKRKKRRGQKKSSKVAVAGDGQGEDNSDEEYHSDVSDGEDGGRVLSKSDKR